MASPCCARTRCSMSAGLIATVTTVAADVTPSLVAVIDDEPAPTAVTRPVPETVATAVCVEAQVTARPASGFPWASFGCAVYCDRSPDTNETLGAVTATDATGTSATVTTTFAVIISLVAVIVADPPPIAVTRPVDDTVATPGCEEVHVTVRPAGALPSAAFGCAEDFEAAPTRRASFGAG